MAYRQSLKSSYSDRLGWFYTSLGADINQLIHSRNAQPLANTLSGFLKFTTENHPSKLTETQALITAIQDMVTALETALDA